MLNKILLTVFVGSTGIAADTSSLQKSLLGKWKLAEDCELKSAEKTEKIKFDNLDIKNKSINGKNEVEVFFIDEKNPKNEVKYVVSYDTRFTKKNSRYDDSTMENMQFARWAEKSLLVATANKWTSQEKTGLYFTTFSISSNGGLDLDRTGISVDGSKDGKHDLPTSPWQMKCHFVKAN